MEATINKLVLIDYIPEQKFKDQIKLQKENEKLHQQNEKLQNKIYEQQQKQQYKINQQQYKQPVTTSVKQPIINEPKQVIKKGLRTLE
jgi:hypothetical protein